MTTLESFVATVAVAAVIGGFFDFYVGKKGQKLIRDRLETTWIEMSYMTISDVVRAESRLAARALFTAFGGRLFSVRKILVVSTFFFLLLALALASAAFRAGSINTKDFLGPDFGVPFAQYITHLVSTSISISVSLVMAQQIARTRFSSAWSGAASAVALLLMQILITLSPYAIRANAPGGWATPIHKYLKLTLARFYPFEYNSAVPSEINYLVDLLLQPISMAWGMLLAATKVDAWYELPRCGYLTHIEWTPYLFWASGLALDCTEFSINLIRLVIFSSFAMTFALFPFRSVLSTVWLRITESDKPVFTLTLAGATALAKSLQELTKLF